MKFIWAFYIVCSARVLRTSGTDLPRSNSHLWVDVFSPTSCPLGHLNYSLSFSGLWIRCLGSTQLIACSVPAASSNVAKRNRIHHQQSGKKGTEREERERERERRQTQEPWRYSLNSEGSSSSCVCVCCLLFPLTETCVVLEEIQKFQALLQVVSTVAAVAPGGHAEATRVYVVGGHDCPWKSKNKVF